MASAALAVGVSIAGLFVIIVVGVIAAFCVYLHHEPSKDTTKVKVFKRRQSTIRKADDVKKTIQRQVDNGDPTAANGDKTSTGFYKCVCCCTSRTGDGDRDGGDPGNTVQTIVAPELQAIPKPPEDIVLEYPSAQEVTVTWRIVDGEYIERFQIFKRLAKKSSVWTKVKSLKQFTRSCRLKGLDCDVKYVFGVLAKNAAGKSAITESVPIVLKQTPVLPGAPSELVTWQKSGTTLTLSWKPPMFDGHLRIIRYHISMRDENMEWQLLTRLQAFDRFMDYRVTGLTQGIPYRFRVAAENDVGTGPASETKDITLHNGPVPPDKPKGPLHYSDITHSSLTVTWQEPEEDGGHPISGYAIELLDARQEKWKKVGVVPKSKSTFWVNKLSEGCEYFVRVVAISNMGNSQPLTGKKFKAKILEIPLNQRSSISRSNNLPRGQRRAGWETGRSVPGTPVRSFRSLNVSGNLSDDFPENPTPSTSSKQSRSRAKRSRSGKPRNPVGVLDFENETGNNIYGSRNRKYMKSDDVETVDVGIETLGGALETVDIGVETERGRDDTMDSDAISTEVSSIYDKYGKYRQNKHVVNKAGNPSNVSYAFR